MNQNANQPENNSYEHGQNQSNFPQDSQRENIPGLNNGFGSESPLDYAFAVAESPVPPKVRRGRDVLVGPASEIAPGEKRIIETEGLSIGVFNIGGTFHAIRNACPHAGAPLCLGNIQTTHRPSEVHEFNPALEGRVIRCPWHGWEFDIISGKGLYDRDSRVATYLCEVNENGEVVLKL